MEEISNFTTISKYSRYDNKKKRREVFDESISRSEKMHLQRFSFLDEKHRKEIEWAFELAKQKFWLPSGRSLQFSGKAIETKNERIYNCAVRHVDSLRSFSEIFFLLLCGCGVGIGLNKRFLDRMPKLVNKNDKNGIVTTYKVADTIEGWADSIEVLLQHYCRNTPYTGRKIVFDYSAIRPAGSILKTGGGKAPGHEGLKKAHTKVKDLLDYIIEELNQSTFKSINVYDILMHCADAVLSGGVRRSATSVIFQLDDVDMMSAKTFFTIDKVKRALVLDDEKNVYCAQIRIGKKLYDIEIPNDADHEYDLKLFKEQKKISWFFVEPQRGRSNNSVILVRKETTKEMFEQIIQKTKQFGEPGFVFAEDKYMLFNPCFTIDTKILTEEGWQTFEELLGKNNFTVVQDNRVLGYVENGEEKWKIDLSETGCTKNISPLAMLTGENKDVYKLKTSCGREVKATEDHHFATTRGMVQLKYLKEGDEILLPIPDLYTPNINNDDYMFGFLSGLVVGDGHISDGVPCISFWFNDGNEDFDLMNKIIKFVSEKAPSNIVTNSQEPHFIKSYQGEMVRYVMNCSKVRDMLAKFSFKKDNCSWVHKTSKDFKSGFLSGMFYADGHIEYGKTNKTISIRITQNDKDRLTNCMLILQELGIVSRVYDLLPEKNTILFDANREPKEYITKETYRLVIGGRDNCKNASFLLDWNIAKKNKLESIFVDHPQQRSHKMRMTSSVFSITYVGKENVYCLKEDNRRTLIANGLTARRCFEVGFIPITLEGICGVQFCNLTTVNGAKIDTKEKFKQAVKAATIGGTLQATYTDFPYLNKASEDMTKEESLLGVSITGIMDNPEILLNKDFQEEMAQYAIKVNAEWAKILSIRPAARITLVKPEGTSSLVLGSSSGIHAHHAKRYFRRIQCNKLDNVYKYFKSINPHACEESVWSANKTDDVVIFPIEVKTKAKFKNDFTAIEHLRAIKSTQQHWVVPGTTDENKKPITHNVSCTVVVKEEEWKDIIEYIYDNKKYFAAVSFLSAMGDKQYKQAPLEAITTPEDEAKWNELISKWKKVDYKNMEEEDDETMLQQEGSCYGGACDIVKV
jgi:hypothetical protein